MANHIFIVGTTHSGSSILYRFLAHHPELAWFSQFSLFDGSIPGRRNLPLVPFYDIVGRKLFGHPWSKNTNASPLGRTRARMTPSPSEGLPMWEYALPSLKHRSYGPDDVPAVRERIVSIIQKARSAQGKTRFLAKVPSLVQAVPALAEIFPQARFMHSVRDGKAVAVSAPPPFPRGSEQAVEYVRKRAEYWKRTAEVMLEMERVLGPERVHTVRYEDVCSDTQGVIRSIFEWCDLPPDESIITRLPRSISSTNARRFVETPVVERDAILDILGGTLPDYGYEPYTELVRS